MKKLYDVYWPDGDVVTPPIIMRESERIPQYLEFVKSFSTCVQAGGNVGVYPKILAKKFETVLTFEPDLENFMCLDVNVGELNVKKFNSALGDCVGKVKTFRVDSEKQNYGATQTMASDHGVQVIRIDDLGLASLDFLMLDIEGWEQFALNGAKATIQKYNPVISLELKGLGDKHGYTDAYTKGWLSALGYKIIKQIGRDWVFV